MEGNFHQLIGISHYMHKRCAESLLGAHLLGFWRVPSAPSEGLSRLTAKSQSKADCDGSFRDAKNAITDRILYLTHTRRK